LFTTPLFQSHPIASRFPNLEDIKITGIDLTKRGGGATKVIEANQAEASQIDDE
jgi:hypothetical protein